MLDNKRPCTKKKYYSQQGATQHMEHVLKNNGKRDHHKTVKLTTAYHCKHCNYWHLTSAVQY